LVQDVRLVVKRIAAAAVRQGEPLEAMLDALVPLMRSGVPGLELLRVAEEEYELARGTRT
jgi:hypothetical protein